MKTFITVISTIIAAIIPVGVFCFLTWSLVAMVPATFAYAWAAKIAIIIGAVLIGGSLTIGASIFFGVMIAALLIVLFNL